MLAERLTAQLLAGRPADSVEGVVRHLLAVQAQDLRAARLALRSRSTGLASSDFDAALTSGEVVVSWFNRGTLHLVMADDYAWLHAVTTPQLATANATRLGQEGVSPTQASRGVDVVRRALQDGPLTRKELQVLLDSAGVPTARQALVHVLFKATLDGVCVRGPMKGNDQAFVLAADWLPRAKPVDRDKALGELGVRYLRAHAHASDRDLAKWAGITLGDARKAWSEPPVVDAAPLPGPRLLGAFDEILMGWVDREFVLAGAQGVVTMNGIFKPIALVKGQAVGTWGLPKGRVQLDPFEGLSGSVVHALEKDAADVERFLAG